MARDKPAPKSRKVLSRARYISQEDLMEARRCVVDPLDKTVKKRQVGKRKTQQDVESSSSIKSDEDLPIVELDSDSDNNSENPDSDSDGSTYSPSHSDVLRYGCQAQTLSTAPPYGQSSSPSAPVPDTLLPLRRSRRNQPYSK